MHKGGYLVFDFFATVVALGNNPSLFSVSCLSVFDQSNRSRLDREFRQSLCRLRCEAGVTVVSRAWLCSAIPVEGVKPALLVPRRCRAGTAGLLL